jgi:hypothetical protein
VKAPFLLVAVLLLGLLFGWVAARTLYEQDLQTLRDQNGILQSKAKPAETVPTSVAVATPQINATPSATPTNLIAALGGQQTPLYALVGKMGWPKNKSDRKMKEVWGQTYIGGTVPLDGYVYYNSTFQNVIFSYKGDLPTGGWVNSKVFGGGFDSNNPAIKTAAVILQSLNINLATQCGIVGEPPLSLVK